MDIEGLGRELLSGVEGRAAKTAGEILIALGRIFEAGRLLQVDSVQIAGVSYHNLGNAGLEYLEETAVDGRVRVPTTLNPAGMDLQRYREMGVSEDFARHQLRIIEAFRRMGVELTCTCTPYLAGNRPSVGQSIAWSESSAVTYANSVLGARSNREGGPSALAAAQCGCTPEYGLHLDENRRATHRVIVEAVLDGPHEWGLLGAAIGRALPGALPYIEGPDSACLEDLKALAAALPTYGAQPMFHLEGVTPEADHGKPAGELLRIGPRDLAETAQAVATEGEAVDLVTLGCPHASEHELATVAALLGGSQVRASLWISTSRAVQERASLTGSVAAIEASGGRVFCDTCFAVAPLRGGPFSRVATDSAKGCYYGRGHNRLEMRLGSLERCVEAAVRGRWR